MNTTRQELQDKALETLRTERRLILNWGTGVGKSRVAINAMNVILNSVPEARFLLMVQETAHKQNWINEMIEAVGMDRTGFILTHTTIDCYASLKKHEKTQWDLIVFDEGHHLRSPIRQNIIKSMQASRVLILTATASDNNDGDDMLETLNFTFGRFMSMTFGLQDAIDSNVLKQPEIHIIPVVLNKDYQEKYDEMSEYQDKKCSEYFERRHYYRLEEEDPENEDTEDAKAKWLNAGARRKRMLGHAKTKVAKRLLNNELKKKKLICFCASVEQIKWLGGENHVSSQNTAKQNRLAIDMFNEGRQQRLFAMGMLQEGQNLKGIESGLIIQLDGKARPFIQKFGRVMRSDTPVLYIIYAKDTHDEGYLQNALSGINDEYIIHHEPFNMDGSECTANTLFPPGKQPVSTPGVQPMKWLIDTQNGRFINTEGQFSNRLNGLLQDLIIIDKPQPFYGISLVKQDGSKDTVYVPKKLSIALLASLSSLPKPDQLPITIDISSNGGWPQYVLTFGRTKVRWDKDIIDNYPKDNNFKVRYLDGIASEIKNRITKD